MFNFAARVHFPQLRHQYSYSRSFVQRLTQHSGNIPPSNLSRSAMVVSADWQRFVPGSPVPPYLVFSKPIEKSPQDNREYRIIQLENGLQATLVHDANADKAAASLDVAVGHLYDPVDMPGLAHFCEHLLFMGTTQFPKENEYSEYLAKNNGGSNAYTSTSNTNYYFNVATPALLGALERFSAFFHSPLFSPSCTSRELNAVDSEHKKNHQADMWRIFQLNKHLSKDGHVWSKFGSGNRESLSMAAKKLKAQGMLDKSGSVACSSKTEPSSIPSRNTSPTLSVSSGDSELEADGGVVGQETRRRLVEWWNKEYCASRMRLCIVGKESLDELANFASIFFSPIANRGCDALPMITEHPFGPNEKGTLISVQTVMSFHAVEVSFPLEYQAPFWRHKPINFISHFVGHEGPGSLHSYLKNQGWLTSLSCGPQTLARGFAMFRITVHLTENGFRNYRPVVLSVFKYLSLLRSAKFESFHQQEVAELSSIRFRFAEKRRPDEYASWISEHMAWPVPRENIINGPQLTWDWNTDSNKNAERKVAEYLENFRVQEGRVVLMARGLEHTKLHPERQWEKEPWYGTEYHVQRLDEEFITEADGLNNIPELFLPGPNKFLPTNLNVEKRTICEPLKRPHLIRETSQSTLWYKKDDKFWVPKAHVIIDMRSPLANSSSRASVLTRLYSDLVTDSLTEISYDADIAGLSYNFVQHPAGLFVSMNGYNDKMSVMVQTVLEKAKGLVVNSQRLAIFKEQAKRDWENFFLGQSYSLSDYYGRYLLTERQWTQEEKLRELPSVTVEDVQHHINELLSEINLRILVVGNIFKDEAIKIAEMAEINLGESSLPPHKLNERALLLPEGCNVVWTSPILNPNQSNSALTYYLHFGPTANQHLRVTSALLTQILTEPTFDVLRTKQQLGYIVSCGAWSLPGASERGIRIVVQSEKTPGYLEERVEEFLDSMKARIDEMSIEEFEGQKSGLERKWLEIDKNLAEETSRYMVHINSGHWDFLRNESDATLVKTITKNDVRSLFLSHVHPSSPTRSKLAVHMISRKPRPKKVSNAAAIAFQTLVRQSGFELDEAAWQNLEVGGELPVLSAFLQYWRDIIGSKEGGEKVLAALPKLVHKFPAEGEGEDPKQPQVTYVEDVKAFKARLEVSADPGPLVHWGDLPARF